MMLLPAPAHAGSWKFSCTGSGTETFSRAGYQESNAWKPPTNPSFGTYYQVSGLSCPSASYTSTSSGDVWTGDISIQETVTLTWMPASGQTAATDPAPPSVMLIESSSASWTAQVYDSHAVYSAGTGKADDGIQDPEVDHSAYGATQGGVSSSANNANMSVPPVHWTSYPVSGGVLTLPKRSLTAHASVTSPTGGGATDFACSVGTYTVAIHPQPYNFHKVPGQGSVNPDGSLKFVYDWSSTTGSKDDLSSCFWHERVTYQGAVGTAAQPNKYYPPDPPFDFPNGVRWLNNPEVGPGTGSQGGAMTGSNTVTDNQLVPPFVDPSLYTNGTYTGTQVFQFDDTSTYQTDVQIPGPDSGPFPIARNFTLYDAHDYQYTVTKDGHTSSVLKSF